MDSRVARFALATGAIDSIDPDCPYAELWIGTHPSGPTLLQNTERTTLQEAVGAELPFLFKLLSAGKALSIQVNKIKDERCCDLSNIVDGTMSVFFLNFATFYFCFLGPP